MRYLLDTSAISEIDKRDRNERVVQFLLSLPASTTFVSAITIGEMRYGIRRMPFGKRRERLELFLEQQIERFAEMILPIDLGVGIAWGDVYASAQMRGV